MNPKTTREQAAVFRKMGVKEIDTCPDAHQKNRRWNGTHENERLAVIIIGICDHQRIHAALGSEECECLVNTVRELIEECVDSGSVNQTGFGLFEVIEPMIDELEAISFARRIQNNIEQTVVAKANGSALPVSVRVRIGVSIKDHHNNDVAETVREAEIAFQSNGHEIPQHRIVLFEPGMKTTLDVDWITECALRKAVFDEQLSVNYQPIYSLEHTRIIGFEALVRWQHPEFGMITPHAFIPIAERCGLIEAIDLWVLEKAVAEIKKRQAVQPGLDGITIHTNLSPLHFTNADILDSVTILLSRYQLQPEQLHIEITESTAMRRCVMRDEVLAALRQQGVHLSIDDFGVGYSSLERLIHLPIDTVKIDQTFIGNDPETIAHREIVAASVQLARSLGLEVIVEGVCGTAQTQTLKAFGCDLVQGHWIAEPRPADAAFALIV